MDPTSGCNAARVSGFSKRLTGMGDVGVQAETRVEGVTERLPQAVFHTFLMKVASRCNLSCDYCYMYHAADQSWRRRPRVMSEETRDAAIDRIAEHVVRHGVKEIHITFHGGEPLLAPPAVWRHLCDRAREKIPAKVNFSVQTNATLITNEFISIFENYQIQIGVSLDGDRAANDQNRRDLTGKSSYNKALEGIGLLRDSGAAPLFNGMLAVIDLRNDPLKVYDALLHFRPTLIDFLLPLHNHDNRPPGKESDNGRHPYSDWMKSIFDRWYEDGDASITVRFFQDIMKLLLGSEFTVESLGLAPADLVVIETDGAIEAVDSLKATYNGAPDLGLNVFDHGFDNALASPAIQERFLGKASLSETCQECSIVEVCGGGYMPTRYRHQSGFRNPSVYCEDLFDLIMHIRRRMSADLEKAGQGAHRA